MNSRTHRNSMALRTLIYFSLMMCVGPLGGFAQEESAPTSTTDFVASATSPFEEQMPRLDLSDRAPVWSKREVMGVSLWQMVAAFLSIFLGFATKKVSDLIFSKKIIPFLKRTRWDVDHLVAEAAQGPIGYLLFILGLGTAFAVLPLPIEPNVSGVSYGVIKIFLTLDFVWFLFRCVDALAEFLRGLSQAAESKVDQQIVPLVRKSMKATVAIICGVWLLQLFGYNVSSLIAGLGIGGLAVALALQDPLSNFFGSVFLFLDKPFAVGDWVKINEVEGIVEEVGFRTSQVRTWPKTLVTIPNKTVAAATIENCSKMTIRMNVQSIGVTYETTAEQMEELLRRIREFLAADEDLAHDMTIVRFTEFANCSLNVLVRFYTIPLAYDDYLATKERINLGLMRIVGEMGLSFAFPTQSIYLEGNMSDAVNKYLDQKPTGRED